MKRKELLEKLTEKGILYKYFAFSGSGSSDTKEGYPEVQSEYNTVNHGLLTNFSYGSGVVEEGGKTMHQIYQEIDRGDAHYPTNYYVIYASSQDLPLVEELLGTSILPIVKSY